MLPCGIVGSVFVGVKLTTSDGRILGDARKRCIFGEKLDNGDNKLVLISRALKSELRLLRG